MQEQTPRAIHKIVLAMHSGECPSCLNLHPAAAMRQNKNDPDLTCPTCGYLITAKEQSAAVRVAFGEIAVNLQLFEEWRQTVK